MGCRRRGLQDRISGMPPPQDRTGRSRRRAKVDGWWSKAGGRRQQLRLSHLSVLRKGDRMAPSYRNINGAWPVGRVASSRGLGGAGTGTEAAGAGARRVQPQVAEMKWRPGWWMEAGWQSVDQCGPGLMQLVWYGEVWEVRYGLADCSSPMQSTQFLCRGGGQLKQSSWSRKAGPNFSVETRTWRAGPSS